MVILDLKLWLKAEDVEPEAELIFLDDGEDTVIPQEGEKPDIEVFEIGVSLPNKEIRRWTMNETSKKAVAQTYGIDTGKWVGKKVTVYTARQNVMGTEKNVIYARIPVKE